MTTSVYAKNAQRITAAIQDSMITGRLENLPELSHEYTQAILELVQTEGPWALAADKSISLKRVADRIMEIRNDNYMTLFDGPSGGKFSAAFIEHLPVTVEHGRNLIGREGVPVEQLVTKLIKMYLEYEVSAANGLTQLADDISVKSPAQGDRFIADILGKTEVGKSAEAVSVGYLIRTALSHDKPSSAVQMAIQAKEPEMVRYLTGAESESRKNTFNKTVTLSIDVLTRMKQTNCDNLLSLAINIGSVDYAKSGSMSSFFASGGTLPEQFVVDAVRTTRTPYDQTFVFAESLSQPGPSKFIPALEGISGDQANMLAEVWLKSLGDAIVRLKKEGATLVRADVVNLIEPLAAKVENQDILKGAALASCIDGAYLAAVPSLKKFKGDILGQDLGM